MTIVKAADGCELFYERTGSGPPVVLIPGLGGDGRFWAGVVARLAGRFDLIVVDHRGAGRSARPPGPYSIGGIARDVLAVLDAEGIHSAHLVGHSTGGAIVQTLALDAPARSRSLVISGSWDRSDARFRAAFEARAALLDAGLIAPYQQLTHVFGYDPAWLDAHEVELQKAVDNAGVALAPLAVTAARVRMLLDFDRSQELHRITQPTLIIGARDDALVPIHHAHRLTALISHAAFSEFQGAHFHPRTDPVPFADRVAAFLDETGR
ncbi:alpha/beta fold hydrolase [Lichenifustis flavocetrariae]|uniref:Alpha/beta hydrolase n=1 Tax=Lichenifustis flavocetrariae TaxID=2949735 RepID=A0AA42CQJ1_9HYPH|nr:alpha/beta fold hydrolase [Lichenifustis flavocetrariae]MCW6511495.1 alpha/beta hydrolase [Lichenifustis flavocetrariae]